MRDEDLSWIRLVGYQHEVVHTRVLERLLTNGDGPRDLTRVTVARALAGDDVVGVDHVQFEHQLTQRRPRRVLELVADLDLADNARVRLGIETKVDSLWSRPQLTESVVSPDRGCLLAVGMTGLTVTDDDLGSLVDSARWSLVNAARWSGVLDAVLDDDPGVVLSQYRDAVREEADDLARARDAVARGVDVTWGRHHQLLEQWAFFDAVLDGLTSSEEWERKKLISGLLVTNFVASAYEEPGLEGRDAGVYIEFMAEGSRKSLCVKVYDSEPPRQLQELQRTFATLLPETDYTRARIPSDHNSTCTVARRVLPPDASGACQAR